MSEPKEMSVCEHCGGEVGDDGMSLSVESDTGETETP